jgi:hypothetical protein
MSNEDGLGKFLHNSSFNNFFIVFLEPIITVQFVVFVTSNFEELLLVDYSLLSTSMI